MPSSSDNVVTATLDTATASVRLTVNWAATGSPISGTAGNVATTTVNAATSVAALGGPNDYPVRSLTAAVAPGGARTGIDHEMPFGVPVYYQALAYGLTGTLMATSATVSVTQPLPASGMGTWLKSLATPSLSCLVTAETMPDWESDIATSVQWVIGRSDPIVVQDVRQFEVGTLAVLTRTAAAEAALLALLQTPGPYLLQVPNDGTSDRFVTVGKYSRKRSVNKFGEPFRVWTLPLTSVARPDPTGWNVAIPGKTYADTQAAAALYSNRTGTYLSRSS